MHPTSSSKASWIKEEVKENDPKGTPKTLMPPIGVNKPNGNENLEGNLERNHVAHLQV
jgi:hypothetical protein